MNRKIFLSIIIPVFNNLNHALDLLKSVDISNSKNIEIIIIDDGSKPKLKKKITEQYLPFKIKIFDLNLFYNVHIFK